MKKHQCLILKHNCLIISAENTAYSHDKKQHSLFIELSEKEKNQYGHPKQQIQKLKHDCNCHWVVTRG